MTFNSFSYFIFLFSVYGVFCFTPDRFRWLVLLAASYAFYATFGAPHLLLLLAFVTGVSYYCGLRLEAAAEERLRSRIFWSGAAACVLLLAAVKYLPPLLAPGSVFLISIGVSYFTFQAVSYMADIFLGKRGAERSIGHHALYMAFFPKLLLGPIERADDLLPQLKKPYEFDYASMRSGLLLLVWGLFKKVVIADHLAPYVNVVYGNVHSFSGLSLIAATYAYGLQLYLDFSGYTDMARGAGRLFGLSLTENFNSPYFATSVADFWRRWHMSFSRWILDYIFKPLQISWRDHGQAGTALALLVTFLFSGMWHGSTWNFVLWGLLHGIYLAASTLYRPYQKRLYRRLGVEKSKWLKWWQIFVTFNLVSFSWVFFRAANCGDAWYMVTHYFAGIERFRSGFLLSQGEFDLAAVLLMLSSYVLLRPVVSTGALPGKRLYFRWAVYLFLAASCQVFWVTKDSFLYIGF